MKPLFSREILLKILPSHPQAGSCGIFRKPQESSLETCGHGPATPIAALRLETSESPGRWLETQPWGPAQPTPNPPNRIGFTRKILDADQGDLFLCFFLRSIILNAWMRLPENQSGNFRLPPQLQL